MTLIQLFLGFSVAFLLIICFFFGCSLVSFGFKYVEKYRQNAFIKKYPREKLAKMIEQSGWISVYELANVNNVSVSFVELLFREYGFCCFGARWHLTPEQHKEFITRAYRS